MAENEVLICAVCGRKIHKTSGEYLFQNGRVLCADCAKTELIRAYAENQDEKTKLNMAVATGDITPEQATIVSAKSGKGKLISGIILLFIGAVALGNIGEEDLTYLVVCLSFIAAGLLLLVLYVSGKMKLKSAIETERSRRLQDREARKYRARNAPNICPNCGAATKGEFCEYCGTPLL